MFGDDLLSDFRCNGVDTRVEQIHFVIGQGRKTHRSDQVRELRGGFHGRGKLALHVVFAEVSCSAVNRRCEAFLAPGERDPELFRWFRCG